MRAAFIIIAFIPDFLLLSVQEQKNFTIQKEVGVLRRPSFRGGEIRN